MPAPFLQDATLTWGVLEFVGPGDAEATFDIEAMEGTNLGNPGPIVETLPSLLIEGAQATVTGWENREIPIRLRLSSNDGEALAEAEAALFQQCQLDIPPPLVWTPPIDLSATTVFDTVVATLSRDTDEGWDVDEILRGDRFYLLTLTCLPFARAVESTVVEALPVPVDPEVEVWTDVDTCGSTTGWTRETNGSDPVGPYVVTGPPTFIEATANIDSEYDHLRLVRTGSIPVPADYYLAVDVRFAASSQVGGHWTAFFNSAWHIPIAIAPGIGEGGSTRLYFDGVGTITSLKIAFDVTTLVRESGAALTVYNVAYTDTLGSSTTTTHRQQSRLAAVDGSAPTQAALRLYDATPGVLGGDNLVYTSRNIDFQPNLRTWIDTSELATSDATMVSGARHTLATPTKYLIPAELLTQGTHALVARMDVNVAGTLTWQARMVHNAGTATVGSGVVISGEVDLAATASGGYEVLDLAAMILPVVEVESDKFMVELTLTGTVDMLLDEAWLFNLDDGVLTWVRDDGNDLTWIEIRSPELGAARPSVWGSDGTLLERAACLDWSCVSFGAHRFDPGTIQIFTITTTSLESQCEIEYFPRFHSHVLGEATA